MAQYKENFSKAQAALAEAKHFDGLQPLNSCLEEFGKLLGNDDNKILKEPLAFVDEMLPKLNDEQKAELGHMYEVRGDILTGLGALKRAAVEYESANKIGRSSEELSAKRRKVSEASKGLPKKGDKVPVTVLTGYLGSGKTTLLNRILQENHGKRIAVIENEFGEVGIDDELIKLNPNSSLEENIVEMNNGCICCTVRGDLIVGLKNFIKRAAKKNQPLDGVIIESTGLADPAPVAQTFFADDFVQQKFSLDGIITLVDAKHIIQHLDEEKPEGVENEAVEQVAFADRILLNKIDLVDEPYLAEVEKRIRMINDKVDIKRCQNSLVDMDYVLGINAFDLDKIMEMDDGFLDDAHDHQHDDRVSSVGINVKGEVDQKKLNEWLGWLLREKGNDLYRTKGVLAVKGAKEKFVFQAVHMAMAGSLQEGRTWADGEERGCKLTFIGKNLDRKELESGFNKCIVK